MRQFTATVLASLASLSVFGAAQAQTYSGYSSSAGTVTSIPAALQAHLPTELTSSFLKLTTSAGSFALPWTVAGASVTATYTSGGVNATISITYINPTKARIRISKPIAGVFSIKQVDFGTVNSRVGFDLIPTAVLSAGSDIGATPTMVTLTGNPWNASLLFTNRVSVAGAAVQADLHKTLIVRYTTDMTNGVFEFDVDTDRLY